VDVHGEHVADFAWVDNAEPLIPRNDNVEIGCDSEPDSFSIGW
jgi:hypothetical protein